MVAQETQGRRIYRGLIKTPDWYTEGPPRDERSSASCQTILTLPYATVLGRWLISADIRLRWVCDRDGPSIWLFGRAGTGTRRADR